MYCKYNLLSINVFFDNGIHAGGTFVVKGSKLKRIKSIIVSMGKFDRVKINLDDCSITQISKLDYNVFKGYGFNNLDYGACVYGNITFELSDKHDDCEGD